MESKEKRKQICSLMTEIFNESDAEIFDQFLKIIKTAIGNIIKNPGEDRFRNIKNTNKVLQAKLFVHPKVQQILEALDFAFDGEVYSYYSDSLAILHDFEIIVEGFEVQAEARRNNRNVDPESARRRQLEVEGELARKEKQVRELQAQVLNDRKDKNQELKDRPSQGSTANNLVFGAKVRTTKDILPPCGPSK